MIYAINIDGPASLIAVEDPRNSPVPIDPPSAMSCRLKFDNDLVSPFCSFILPFPFLK